MSDLCPYRILFYHIPNIGGSTLVKYINTLIMVVNILLSDIKLRSSSIFLYWVI